MPTPSTPDTLRSLNPGAVLADYLKTCGEPMHPGSTFLARLAAYCDETITLDALQRRQTMSEWKLVSVDCWARDDYRIGRHEYGLPDKRRVRFSLTHGKVFLGSFDYLDEAKGGADWCDRNMRRLAA